MTRTKPLSSHKTAKRVTCTRKIWKSPTDHENQGLWGFLAILSVKLKIMSHIYSKYHLFYLYLSIGKLWQYPTKYDKIFLVSVDSMGIVPRLPFSETERGFYEHVRSFDAAFGGFYHLDIHRQSQQPEID